LVADECRITKEGNPYYAWHTKGQTPIKRQKLEIHKGVNIFGALSMKTGKIIYLTAKKKNGQAAAALLDKSKEFKNRHFNEKDKILLIWDNVSCHKSQEVKHWLTQNPNQIELDNFPPYSPEMNPIEKVWKKLKQRINHLRGEASLIEITQKAREFLNNNAFHYKLLGFGNLRIFK